MDGETVKFEKWM